MHSFRINFYIHLALLSITSGLCAEGASKITAQHNQKIIGELPFANEQDFADASKGFVAPLPNNGTIKNKNGQVIWDLAAYDFVNRQDKPADTVNPSLFRQTKLLTKAGLFQVTEGIYQIRGADLSNMTIVEGKTGLIIIDTLLSAETATAALDLYYQNRPKKPIKAIIYTHSHADHFGGVKGMITQEQVDQKQVKVIAPKGFTAASLDENIMVGNTMSRRALYMYGSLIPVGLQGQMSAGLGLTTSKGEISLILPTDFIDKTGQELEIDGVRFVFLMAPGSEAPAEMLFFLPQFKALCAAEDATHTMHNLYTLRGTKIRDAKAWAKYLNEAIEMFGSKTEVVFAQHHWPKWGKEQVIDFLEKQRDMYKYLHDQTLHLANQGFTMLEIGERIKLPDSLAKEWYNRGYYGSLNHNVKSVYNFYLGWFTGNPATLYELPETMAAKKYVDYMGGADTLLQKAQKDFEAGEYRWTAQVLNHLVNAEPTNQTAKNLLANTLEQLGYQAENATWRNFYLTGAQELRFGVKKMEMPSSDSKDIAAVMPIESFFDYLSIKLDGVKAAQYPMTINFNLIDPDKRYLIQIKNGVLNYFINKNSDQADFTISVKREDLDFLILGQDKIKNLIEKKKVKIDGSFESFEKFESLFSEFDLWFNVVGSQTTEA